MPAETGAGAAVRRRTRRRREGAREASYVLRGDAADALGLLRRVEGRRVAERADPDGLLPDRRLVGETLGEDHVQHRQQQPRVGVRAHLDVLEGTCGLGAPRVDDDHPAAALGDAAELVLDPRCVEGTAVGDQRVAADDQQEVGPRQIGEGQLRHRAVEERARREPAVDVLRPGAVAVLGAEGLQERGEPDGVGVGEGRRVAQVAADRVPRELLEPRRDVVQR